MKLRKQDNPVAMRTDSLPPPAPLSRVTQGLYMLVVVAVIAYLVLLVWRFSTRLELRGVVLVDELPVAATRDGVLAMRRTSGDQVRRGDVLAVIDPVLGCAMSVGEDSRLEQARHQLRVARERQKLAALHVQQIQDRAPGATLRRALELDGSRGVSLMEWELDLQEAQQDMALARATRESLEQRVAEILAQAALGNVLPPECRKQNLAAPQGGEVASLLRRNGEFVRRGETVALLRGENAGTYIEVYPESGELQALAPGKEVQVRFPDGEESPAVITVVGAAAAAEPVLQTDAYVPVENALRARIEAVDPRDAERWKRYQRMDVEVQVKR